MTSYSKTATTIWLYDVPRSIAEDPRIAFLQSNLFWQVSCVKSKTKACTDTSAWTINDQTDVDVFGIGDSSLDLIIATKNDSLQISVYKLAPSLFKLICRSAEFTLNNQTDGDAFSQLSVFS